MTQADTVYAADRYRAIGIQAFAIKDFRLAEKMFREAFALTPTPDIAIGIGESLGQMEKYAEARKEFEQALKLDPKFSKAWYNMGVMYERANMTVEAEAAYEKGMAIDPNFAEGMNNLANCKRALMKLPEAEACYRRAAELGYPAAQLNLSLCLMLRGDYVEGLKLFERRAEWAGDDAYQPAREILRILDAAGKA